MKLSILAAGKSERIYNKIKKNKCLININGTSIIKNIVQCGIKNKIKEIEIVIGFKGNNIKNHLKNYKNITYINNNFFKSRDMMHSFYLSLNKANQDILICYSDIFFKPDLFKKIIENTNKHKKSVFVPVLKNWKKIWKIRNKLHKNDAEDLKIDKKKIL